MFYEHLELVSGHQVVKKIGESHSLLYKNIIGVFFATKLPCKLKSNKTIKLFRCQGKPATFLLYSIRLRDFKALLFYAPLLQIPAVLYYLIVYCISTKSFIFYPVLN